MNAEHEMTTHVPESWEAPAPRPRLSSTESMKGAMAVVWCVVVAIIAVVTTLWLSSTRKWHYTFEDVTVQGSDDAAWDSLRRDMDESSLNRRGKDGGELVAVLPFGKDILGNKYRLIFKHPGSGSVMSMDEHERRSHDINVSHTLKRQRQ